MSATTVIAPADVLAFASDVTNEVHWRTGVTEPGFIAESPLRVLPRDELLSCATPIESAHAQLDADHGRADHGGTPRGVGKEGDAQPPSFGRRFGHGEEPNDERRTSD